MDERELGQEVERMADWSVQFLKFFSSHPVNGEYTAGNLANRYIFHCKIRNEQSIADAVKYDIEMEQKALVSPPAVDTYLADLGIFGLKKKVQRALAVSLENDPKILYDGDRRGRLYRFRTTRPSIRARDVAVFISYYLYQNPEEFNIRDLGEEVREWATDFHMKIERNDQTGFYRSEPNKPYLLTLSFYRPQTTDFPFSFNHPDVKSKYERESRSDLLEWCKNVYTEKWFKYSVSNILRYLRKELDCISEGSKRGLWIHKSHFRKNPDSEEVDFSDILEFDNHFAILHNRVSSFKDPDVVSIMLKQLVAQLELMIIRIKKPQQRDFLPLQSNTQTSHDLGKEHVGPRGRRALQRQEYLRILAADRIGAEIVESESDFAEKDNRIENLLNRAEKRKALMEHFDEVHGHLAERDKLALIRNQNTDWKILENELLDFHEAFGKNVTTAQLQQEEINMDAGVGGNTRIREKIEKFLGDKPRNTAEILEHINSTMRHGTTAQQLGNVLSKDKNIVKIGYIKRSGILSGGYDICEWATRNWVSSNYPGWQEGTPITIDNDGNVTTSASTD